MKSPLTNLLSDVIFTNNQPTGHPDGAPGNLPLFPSPVRPPACLSWASCCKGLKVRIPWKKLASCCNLRAFLFFGFVFVLQASLNHHIERINHIMALDFIDFHKPTSTKKHINIQQHQKKHQTRTQETNKNCGFIDIPKHLQRPRKPTSNSPRCGVQFSKF